MDVTTIDTAQEELGPVDYLVIEFPAGHQNFTGEVAEELARLSESGTIRVLDLLILSKNEDGSVDALEIDDTPEVDAIRALEADIAEILAADDVELLAESMEPGTDASTWTLTLREGVVFSDGTPFDAASVQANCADDARYERKTASNGRAFFTLKAANQQVIGTSQMYASESSRESGIASVKANGTTESVKDGT